MRFTNNTLCENMSCDMQHDNAAKPDQGAASDLRRTSRYDSVNLLWYESLNGSSQGRLEGIGSTINLSTGGLCIRTAKPLEQGVKLSVEILTKMERKIKALCKVAYVSKDSEDFHVNGLRFIEISEGDMDYLRIHFPPSAEEI